MTLDQLADLADVIGVLLIVASLVYVARQLRQNTEMMRAAASSGRVERDYQIVSPIIDNREIAQMWAKGKGISIVWTRSINFGCFSSSEEP